jgi:hypothetical protein
VIELPTSRLRAALRKPRVFYLQSLAESENEIMVIDAS